MGRPGETQEVANAIVFLASKEASYITGEEININGGLIWINAMNPNSHSFLLK